MTKIFEIISNPWLAIVLVCGAIAYGLYVILFTKQKSRSDFRKEGTIKSDTEITEFVNQNLDLVVALLRQIDSRLESLGTEFGAKDAGISQAEAFGGNRDSKILYIYGRPGQSSWSN